MNPFTFISNYYQDFLRWWSSAEVVYWISILKTISGIISIALFLAIVILIFKLGVIKNKWNTFFESARRRPPIPKSGEIIKRWLAIKARIETQKEAECRLAVIEADKLFDDFLVRIGFKGKDMGERLKNITSGQLSVIDAVWHSHRIRNAIVHKPDFKINCAEAEEALKAYEKAFKEFRLLS